MKPHPKEDENRGKLISLPHAIAGDRMQRSERLRQGVLLPQAGTVKYMNSVRVGSVESWG